MMGMLRDSLRRRLGEEEAVLVSDSGGGEENLRVARGDLGGSPYSSLLFWPLANRSSSDLWGGGQHGLSRQPESPVPAGPRAAAHPGRGLSCSQGPWGAGAEGQSRPWGPSPWAVGAGGGPWASSCLRLHSGPGALAGGRAWGDGEHSAHTVPQTRPAGHQWAQRDQGPGCRRPLSHEPFSGPQGARHRLRPPAPVLSGTRAEKAKTFPSPSLHPFPFLSLNIFIDL